MIDDQQADKPADAQGEQPNEPIQQEEPMPSSESKEPVDAQGQVDELPEDVSERTREQFNKLKEANKALKEQLAKKEEIEPIFDSMRPKSQTGLTQGQLDQVTDIDLEGNKFINEDKLSNLLATSTQKAEDAIAQVNRFIEDQQTREAFTAIPQLDPKKTEFDPELHRATRAYILDSMMNPKEYNGKQLSYREAGELAMKATKAEIAKVEQEAAQQMSDKEQGSLEASGRSDRRANVNVTEDELRNRIRESNDDDALAALLGD